MRGYHTISVTVVGFLMVNGFEKFDNLIMCKSLENEDAITDDPSGDQTILLGKKSVFPLS